MDKKSPVDKNGRPLKFGCIVAGFIRNGTGPPKYIFGRLMCAAGPGKSLIETERRSYVVENKTIEIKID